MLTHTDLDTNQQQVIIGSTKRLQYYYNDNELIESHITIEKLRLLQQETVRETVQLSILYMKQGYEMENRVFWRSFFISFFLSVFFTFTIEKITSLRHVFLNLITLLINALTGLCKIQTLNLIPLFPQTCDNVLPPIIEQLKHIDFMSKSFDLGFFLLFFCLFFIFTFLVLRLIEKDFSFMGFSIKGGFKIEKVFLFYFVCQKCLLAC